MRTNKVRRNQASRVKDSEERQMRDRQGHGWRTRTRDRGRNSLLALRIHSVERLVTGEKILDERGAIAAMATLGRIRARQAGVVGAGNRRAIGVGWARDQRGHPMDCVALWYCGWVWSDSQVPTTPLRNCEPDVKLL